MALSRIIAQESAVHALRSSIQREAVAHAYLFTGPQGTGKTTAALAFAAALNCNSPTGDGDACGECLSCLRTQSGNDADIQLIAPDGNQTKIDQMQEMIKSLNYAPLYGRYKVLIVEQADTLNASSENCILKILEEPPAYAVLILLSANPNSLLPTIRSRCMTVRFRRANPEEIEKALRGCCSLSEDEISVVAAGSQGSIGRAIRMASDPDFMDERRDVLRAVAEWAEGPSILSLRLAESLRKMAEPKKNDPDARPRVRRLNDYLDHLLSWYGDLLSLNVRGDDAPVSNVDYTDFLRDMSRRYTSARLRRSILRIMDTRHYLEGNITPQLALENLFLELHPD